MSQEPETYRWPFFDEAHRDFADRVEKWAAEHIGMEPRLYADLEAESVRYVRALGTAGLLQVVAPEEGGAAIDVRMICIARETLARYSALAEVMFAMQGLGSAPITLFGRLETQRKYLPGVRAGDKVAAFALSEPEAGSDVASLATIATKVAGGWRLNGVKTWISNAGIADHYVVVARTAEAPGAKGLSAFVMDGDTPGFRVVEKLHIISPHVIATIEFKDCFVPDENLLGQPGEGFKVAMATLDIFRSTVGASALGFARRALQEALARASGRISMGRPLFEHQLIQGKIADMATEIDAAALLVYRAAWTRDALSVRITRESSMAKLYATEMAQRVVDEAVQIFGGLGVTKGNKPEELYRDVRALRIYEGASEIQRVIIARQTMRAFSD